MGMGIEMGKILFTIKPHSIIDVITNSSSELFVGKSQSKDEIKELIKEAYPAYLTEYCEVKNISELTADELDTYLYYHYDGWSNYLQRTKQGVVPGFTKEEMYEVGEYGTYIKNDFTENNLDKIKEAIDPKNEMYFLFSIDDNPDWDCQENLMDIMERYHLG